VTRAALAGRQQRLGAGVVIGSNVFNLAALLGAALADMVRTRRHQLRAVAAGSDEAEAVKVAARARQKLVRERTRHALRMRSAAGVLPGRAAGLRRAGADRAPSNCWPRTPARPRRPG
jgi:hypothetical protein